MVATRAGAGAASGGAGSAATHTGPSTHRGPAGLDQDTYAPQAKAAAAAAPGPNAPAAGPPASGSSSARSFGQGVPRPRRKDLERQAYIELDVDGVQKEQMKRAHKAYGSPSARSDACKWQQTNEEYHPITPLSPLLPPLPHKPHERCNCSFSFNQQFGQIGLGSPSVVRVALLSHTPHPSPARARCLMLPCCSACTDPFPLPAPCVRSLSRASSPSGRSRLTRLVRLRAGLPARRRKRASWMPSRRSRRSVAREARAASASRRRRRTTQISTIAWTWTRTASQLIARESVAEAMSVSVGATVGPGVTARPGAFPACILAFNSSFHIVLTKYTARQREKRVHVCIAGV